MLWDFNGVIFVWQLLFVACQLVDFSLLIAILNHLKQSSAEISELKVCSSNRIRISLCFFIFIFLLVVVAFEIVQVFDTGRCKVNAISQLGLALHLKFRLL